MKQHYIYVCFIKSMCLNCLVMQPVLFWKTVLPHISELNVLGHCESAKPCLVWSYWYWVCRCFAIAVVFSSAHSSGWTYSKSNWQTTKKQIPNEKISYPHFQIPFYTKSTSFWKNSRRTWLVSSCTTPFPHQEIHKSGFTGRCIHRAGLETTPPSSNTHNLSL